MTQTEQPVGGRRPHRIRRGVFALAASLSACLLLASGPAAAAEPLRIGTSSTGLLIWIAERMGAFEDAGVAVEVERISSGVEGAERSASGSLDLAASSEFAFTSKAVQGAGICIYATLSASRTVRLLGRPDRVGPEPEDLRGKTIGVTYGSAAGFFLSQFLALEGIAEHDVTLVDLVPREMVESMADGSVDAAIVWEPYVTQIRDILGGQAVEYEGQALQHYYFTLNGRCGLAEERPRELQAVMRGLLSADRLAREDPARAKELVAPVLGVDGDEIERIWALHTVSLSLPQDLLSLIEIESQWLAATGQTYAGIENALDWMRPAPLHAVAPGAVQMVW